MHLFLNDVMMTLKLLSLPTAVAATADRTTRTSRGKRPSCRCLRSGQSRRLPCLRSPRRRRLRRQNPTGLRRAERRYRLRNERPLRELRLRPLSALLLLPPSRRLLFQCPSFSTMICSYQNLKTIAINS